MSNGARNLRPFVPSGADYALAKQFFCAIGFHVEFEAEDVAGMRCGDAAFLLQNYANSEMQQNLMIAFDVTDLDAWWSALGASGALAMPGVKAREPTLFPWGRREVHLIDPAGVCWHVGQAGA